MFKKTNTNASNDGNINSLGVQLDHEYCRYDHLNPIPIRQSLIQQRIESLSIRRSELAKRIGYENISKGIRRIEQWETTQTIPNSEQGKNLLVQLNLTKKEVEQDKRTHCNLIKSQQIYRENEFEKRLLRSHYCLLLDNIQQIQSTPQWSDILLPKVGVFTYYAKVPSMSLGQLLDEAQC